MKDDFEYTTPLQCKILTYKLNETDLEVIQRDIEKYCNDGYFNYRVISQISTTIENNLYIATVVYENKFKWFKFLIILITLILVFAFILFMIIMFSLGNK